jgi:hypothetical protein
MWSRDIIMLLEETPKLSTKSKSTSEKKKIVEFINRLEKKGYLPPNLQDWIDRVNDNHKELRQMIGGKAVDLEIRVAKNQGPLDDAKAQEMYDRIVNLCRTAIPRQEDAHILTQPGKDERLFQRLRAYGNIHSKDSLKYPTVNSSSHNVVKLSKQIANAGTNIFGRNDKEKLNDLNKIISELGIEWSKKQVKEDVNLSITIDTSATIFPKLGHLGCDEVSCFKQGGSNEKNKYILGQSYNSFVVYIEKNGVKVVRCWGFLSKDLRTFSVSNIYFKNDIQEGTIIESLRILFADLLGCGEEDIYHHENMIRVRGGVYKNAYGNWSFSLDKEIQWQELVTVFDDIEAFKCYRCLIAIPEELEWEYIDNILTCERCAKDSSLCCITGERTRNQTHFIMPDGKKSFAKMENAMKYGTPCQKCQYYSHIDALKNKRCANTECSEHR